MKIMLMVSLLLLTNNSLFAEQFNEITSNLVGLQRGSLIWGDYDNDGDLDLFISGNVNDNGLSESKLYKNNNGVFVDIKQNFVGVFASSSDWGDYDNDGDLDIIICGDTLWFKGVTKIYRNDNGIFNEINAHIVGAFRGSVQWGDYDNDGDLDILITGSITRIYENINGNFVNKQFNFKYLDYAEAAWGDYDNDGDLDFALIGRYDGDPYSKIFRNDNGLSYDSMVELTQLYNDYSFRGTAWGDYDNDGDLDLMISGEYEINKYITELYTNDNNTFINSNQNFPGITSSSIAWGDYDNEGFSDLFLSGASMSNNLSKIYHNDIGKITEINDSIVNVRCSAIALGDYDNDGDLDFVISGRGGINLTKLYQNNNKEKNTKPIPPNQLILNMYEDSLVMEWNEGYDSQTPTITLTYNLMAGTEENGIDLISPMCDINTGYRRIPKMGNVQFVKKYRLNYVTKKSFSWNVQTIDNGYMGSVFALPNIKKCVNRIHNLCIQDTTILLTDIYPNGTYYAVDGVEKTKFDVLTEGVGQHIITIINDPGNGNKYTVKQYVDIYPLPEPQIIGKSQVCYNSELVYYSRNNTNMKNRWELKGYGKIYPSQDSCYISWDKVGKSKLKLIQTSEFGCSDSIEIEITINLLPTPKISGNTKPIENTRSIYSSNNVNGLKYKWIITGGTIDGNDNEDNVAIIWGSHGKGKIKLIETTVLGCTDSTTVDISIIESIIDSTITICNQTWMKNNLNVSHYRNGDTIPEIRDAIQWKNLTTGAWCYYNNDSTNGKIYGKLYNWYAVNDPRGLAPEGWHVPTDDDWKELEICLGMSQEEADADNWRGTDEGSQLAGKYNLWEDGNLRNNISFTKSGFNALPGGYRASQFYNIGENASFWTSTVYQTSGISRRLSYDNSAIYKDVDNKNAGYSVRCVRKYSLNRKTILLKCDSVNGKPGDIVKIPIYLYNQQNLDSVNITEFKAELHYNSTMLVPLNGSVKHNGNDSWIDLSLNPNDLQDSMFIPARKFAVTLGNDTVTSLTLENVIPIGGSVEIRTIPGLFRVEGICMEGDHARLIEIDGKVTLKIIHPNPTSDKFTIDYEVVEDAQTKIYIANFFGEIIKTLVNEKIKHGKYTVSVGVNDLPSGLYFIILQTPTLKKALKMEIIK